MMGTGMPTTARQMMAQRIDKPRVPRPKVGFYGCNDGIVRLTYRVPRKTYPRGLRLECPRCNNTHEVAVMWRALVPADRGKEALCLD